MLSVNDFRALEIIESRQMPKYAQMYLRITQSNSNWGTVPCAWDFKDKVSCQSTWAFVPEYLLAP